MIKQFCEKHWLWVDGICPDCMLEMSAKVDMPSLPKPEPANTAGECPRCERLESEIRQLKLDRQNAQTSNEIHKHAYEDYAKRCERLERALLPLVQLANGWTDRLDELPDNASIYQDDLNRAYYAGQLREARAALALKTNGGGEG